MSTLSDKESNNLSKLLSALNELGHGIKGELSFKTGRVVRRMAYEWVYETDPKDTGPVDDALAFRTVEYNDSDNPGPIEYR